MSASARSTFMWQAFARHERVYANLNRNPPLLELVVELADAVLGLRDGHAVPGDDDTRLGLFEHLDRAFDRLRLVNLLFPARLHGLYLTEGAEEHVGERAVHRLAT